VRRQQSGGEQLQKLTTCLMFVGDQFGRAEEAMNLYVSLFENSRILEIAR
jgi:predicted 3-demethylubiquinone-9 3-methyltransferase (glyoxalase superfamily)